MEPFYFSLPELIAIVSWNNRWPKRDVLRASFQLSRSNYMSFRSAMEWLAEHPNALPG